MKILCLSDLHLSQNVEVYRVRDQVNSIDEEYDAVIISGDVFESRFLHSHSPYKQLYKIFGDIPVIFCLGNHEYFYKTVEQTHERMRQAKNVIYSNIVCLDIANKCVLEDRILIVGNVLWYDGTLRDYLDQDLYTFANGCWADKYIRKFNYKKEFDKCLKTIETEINNSDEPLKLLVTHTCPHAELNMHKVNPSNFNAFSGTKNILEFLDVDYSICGHTHRRTIGQVLNETTCINVGNDFHIPLQYFILDI